MLPPTYVHTVLLYTQSVLINIYTLYIFTMYLVIHSTYYTYDITLVLLLLDGGSYAASLP